jgi:glycosyltransferase involved in cell wall biosynthesis
MSPSGPAIGHPPARSADARPTGRVLELLGPSAGGIRRHVDVLARHLPEHGWKTTVAGPPGVMDGLTTAATPISVGLHPARATSALRGIRRVVADADVDVIHAHGLTAGWLAALARTGRPVVVTVHNVVLKESAGRAAPVLHHLQSLLPNHVEQVIAVSPAIAAPMGARGRRPVEVIIPASPPPRVERTSESIRDELGLGPGDPLVVTVARLHPQKAIGDLLTATAEIRDRIPGVRVAVVGDGPQRVELAAAARTSGVADVVTFVGAQPDGPSWMAAADVVAVPSIWEGSPLVVAEALLLGRPLVATDVGDVGEVVQDGRTGRLVPASQPSLLAAAIIDVLEAPARAERLGEAGRALAVGRYGVSPLVAAVAVVYDRVTGRAPT